MRRNRGRWQTLFVLAGVAGAGLLGTVAGPVAAQACTATLTITPNTVSPGQQNVVLSGSGHNPNSNISLAQDGATVAPNATTTNASGAFTFNGTAASTAGSHTVVATDAGGRCSQATYTVTGTTVTTVITQGTGTTATTADLVTTATHNGTFVAGQGSTLNVRVTNLGPAPTSTGSIQLTVSLPPGIVPHSGSTSDFACSTDGRTILCTRTASLAAGLSVDLSFLFAIAPNASPTSTIVVNATDPRVFDPNTTNNTVNVPVQTLQSIGSPIGTAAPSYGFPIPGIAGGGGAPQQQQQQQQIVTAAPASGAAPAAAVQSSRLPFTGSRLGGELRLGAVVLAAGLVLVAVARRRRRHAAGR